MIPASIMAMGVTATGPLGLVAAGAVTVGSLAWVAHTNRRRREERARAQREILRLEDENRGLRRLVERLRKALEKKVTQVKVLLKALQELRAEPRGRTA